jgi:hypothetical protein
VVLTDFFNRAAVALGARIGYDDAVMRRTDFTHALEADFDSHDSPD